MNPALILGLAQMGGSLLGAKSQGSALRQQARDAAYAGTMERAQMKEQGRADAADRQRYLASVLGSQRAAMASGGIGGGRSAALMAGQAQAGAARAQSIADYNLRMGLSASQRGQSARVSGLATSIRQTQIDLFGDLLSGGLDVHQAWEAEQAARRQT